MPMSPAQRGRSIFLATLAAATLSACGGGVPTAQDTAAVPMTSARTFTPGSALPSQLLFIPNGQGSVYIYPLVHPNKTGPVALVTGLLGFQTQTAVDAKGNFYIAAQGSGFFNPKEFYVAKIAPPYTSAPTFLQTSWKGQIFAAIGLTVDKKGTIYVSACGDYCGVDTAVRGVLVYPPGAQTPTQYITLPRFDTMGALTSDANGNVYGLTWNKNTLVADAFEIAAGTTTAKLLNLHGFAGNGDSAGGIATDLHGDIYVTNPGLDSSYVLEYKPGQHEPFRQIDLGAWISMVAYPLFLTVGPNGALYVPIGCGAGTQATGKCPQVYAFRSGADRAFETVGSQSSAGSTISVSTFPNAMLQGSQQ